MTVFGEDRSTFTAVRRQFVPRRLKIYDGIDVRLDYCREKNRTRACTTTNLPVYKAVGSSGFLILTTYKSGTVIIIIIIIYTFV